MTLAALAATVKLLLDISETSMAPLIVLRAVGVGGQTGLAKTKPTICKGRVALQMIRFVPVHSECASF